MADIPAVKDFFPGLSGFIHSNILEGVKYPWGAIDRIQEYIYHQMNGDGDSPLPDGLEIVEGGEPHLYASKTVRLTTRLLIGELSIVIGKGTMIERTAMIKPHTIIGQNCEVRHGAYLRGNVIAGDHCTLGHTTEIKNAIIMNHSEMGHFNYIGDSIIGSYVNIGAGTKLANLKFRKPEDKLAVAFPEITFMAGGKKVESGVNKLGAIIGDHCELGCNSVLSPASLLLPEVWVYPNCTVPSGVYGPKRFLAPDDIKIKERPLPK